MDHRDSYCRFPLPGVSLVVPLAIRNETELAQMADLARQLLSDHAQAKRRRSINS